MIDVHTHILPKIDDGSKSIDESIALLRMEMEQGIDKIIATPHFYSHRHSLESFLEKRKKSYNKLKAAMADLQKEEKLPLIYLGAEVYYFDGISQTSMLPKLCIEGTNILLLEMPFCQWDKRIYDEVRCLVVQHNFTVILAHVDRYLRYQKNKVYFWKVLSLPVHIQFNGECFLSFFERRFPIRYLKEGHTVLFGSDCHNMTKRLPNLKQARNYIKKKVGKECLKRSDALANELFESLYIVD